jgi:hypothetical protein
MKEMHGKGKMEAAKMHYEALMAALAALGMSLAEFEEQMGGEEPEDGEEYAESEESSEEGEEMAEKKPIDKAKVAVIVARMKNKMKG